jgi:predicted PurR-regulated permease PerM
MTSTNLQIHRISIALWLVVAGLVVTTLVVAANQLIPIAVAVMIWFLINALANGIRTVRVRGIRLPQRYALALALVLLFGLIFVIGNLTAGNVAAVSDNAQAYERNLRDMIAEIAGYFGVREYINFESMTDRIEVGNLLSRVATALGGLVSSAGIVFIYVLFLLIEQQSFGKKMNALFPDSARQRRVRRMMAEISHDIQTYLWVITLMSALVGLVAYGIMMWVGLDYAVFWAMLIFLLNYIPTIGVWLGLIFPGLLALVQFDTLSPFLIVVLGTGAAQTVIANILQPRMAGRALNISQFVVILSLFLWGAMWGVPGMFLCVPITVILIIVFSYFPETRAVAIVLSGDGRIRDFSDPTAEDHRAPEALPAPAPDDGQSRSERRAG